MIFDFSVVEGKFSINLTVVVVIGFNEDVSVDSWNVFKVVGDEVITDLSIGGVEEKICSITASLTFIVVVVVLVSDVTSICFICSDCSVVISFSYSSVINKKNG